MVPRQRSLPSGVMAERRHSDLPASRHSSSAARTSWPSAKMSASTVIGRPMMRRTAKPGALGATRSITTGERAVAALAEGACSLFTGSTASSSAISTSPGCRRSGIDRPSSRRGSPSMAPAPGSSGLRLTGTAWSLAKSLLIRTTSPCCACRGSAASRRASAVTGRRRSRQAANGLRRPPVAVEIGCRLSDLAFNVGGKSFRQEQAVGRGDGEPQRTTPRGDIGRQAARFGDDADGRRNAGKRIEFLDVPSGASVPPRGGREDAVEARIRQLAVPRPGETRRPRPQGTIGLAAGRGNDRTQGTGRQKTEPQQAEGRCAGIGQSHKVRSPPGCDPVGVGPHRDGVCDGTVEARIDDIALISALEQIPGLVGAGAVERQPVEDDVEAKAQATPFAQRGDLMDRFFDRTADPQPGIRLGKIADQQRIVASRQEGIETHMVETQVGGSGQARLPIAVAVEIVDMANARRPHLQTPTRLSHPGRPGRGLQAPAHSLETAEPATGCEE